MDFIQSSLVQFIIVVLISVITLGATVLIYLKERRIKKISYEISRISLLSVKEVIEKEVQILYRGKEIKEVQLIILQIISSGNVSIRREDFDTPISIKFGRETRLLSATIVEKKPEDLEISIDIAENKVILQPFLLNPDDRFTIKILASKAGKDLKVEGRIAGVKKIGDESATELRRFRTVIKVNFIATSIYVITLIFTMIFLADPLQTVVLNSLVLLSIITCSVYSILRCIFYRKIVKNQKKFNYLLKETDLEEEKETD